MLSCGVRGVSIAFATLAIAGQSALAQQTVVAPADSPQLAASDSSRSTGDTVRYVPLTLGQKAALYSSRTFSARAILGASYAAGLAQWRHTPKEWGTGMSGYGRRDAAAYGGLIVGRTAAFGFGALLHEDPRFFRSTHNGFVPRTKDVLRSSLTVRTDDGGSHIAWSRAAAALVTGFAVNSWEPRRMHSTHHALMLSLAGFLSYGTATFTQEFTPDVRRYVFHHLHIDHQP